VVRLLPTKGAGRGHHKPETPMNAKEVLKTGALWLAVAILFLAALPLMAIGAWVLRAVLLIAMLIALVGGCILYCVVPRFRDWAHHFAHPTTEASR
jgi:fatty acid desaturase